MNAKLDIKIGVQMKRRLDAERFRPSILRTSSFHYTSDLDSCSTLLPTIAAVIYGDISSARAALDETTTHIAVRLDNPTHTTSLGAGVVPLAKGHRDIMLGDGDVVNANSITVALAEVISELKEIAKY